ncbi:2187_t:CDS:2, partial [Gigaspora rosea]
GSVPHGLGWPGFSKNLKSNQKTVKALTNSNLATMATPQWAF